jgi:hypothetical protein
MTTSTDIGNRALQLIGTRTSMSSLAESSNEAIQTTIAYDPIQRWCFGLANWNFARNTAALTLAKGPSTGPTWSSALPSPAWNYEYLLPTDFIKAIYLTNQDVNTGTAAPQNFLGQPKRFVLSVDTISSTQREVLLTNEVVAILIYTSLVGDPTVWPWYFERLVVTSLAHALCMPLTGDKKLLAELEQRMEQMISISSQANTVEALIIPDTTPEWIQAQGINYPYRRLDGKTMPIMPQAQRPPQRQGGDQ